MLTEQQPCCAYNSRQYDGRHQHEVRADFIHAKPTQVCRKSIEIEDESVDERHAHQPAHPCGVSAYFSEIIEEKSTKKCNRGAEHDDGQGLRYQWISLEIDEHPEVKNAREDVRPDAFKAVLELHGFDHVQRFHHKHRKNRHHES